MAGPAGAETQNHPQGPEFLGPLTPIEKVMSARILSGQFNVAVPLDVDEARLRIDINNPVEANQLMHLKWQKVRGVEWQKVGGSTSEKVQGWARGRGRKLRELFRDPTAVSQDLIDGLETMGFDLPQEADQSRTEQFFANRFYRHFAGDEDRSVGHLVDHFFRKALDPTDGEFKEELAIKSLHQVDALDLVLRPILKGDTYERFKAVLKAKIDAKAGKIKLNKREVPKIVLDDGAIEVLGYFQLPTDEAEVQPEETIATPTTPGATPEIGQAGAQVFPGPATEATTGQPVVATAPFAQTTEPVVSAVGTQPSGEAVVSRGAAPVSEPAEPPRAQPDHGPRQINLPNNLNLAPDEFIGSLRTELDAEPQRLNIVNIPLESIKGYLGKSAVSGNDRVLDEGQAELVYLGDQIGYAVKIRGLQIHAERIGVTVEPILNMTLVNDNGDIKAEIDGPIENLPGGITGLIARGKAEGTIREELGKLTDTFRKKLDEDINWGNTEPVWKTGKVYITRYGIIVEVNRTEQVEVAAEQPTGSAHTLAVTEGTEDVAVAWLDTNRERLLSDVFGVLRDNKEKQNVIVNVPVRDIIQHFFDAGFEDRNVNLTDAIPEFGQDTELGQWLRIKQIAISDRVETPVEVKVDILLSNIEGAIKAELSSYGPIPQVIIDDIQQRLKQFTPAFVEKMNQALYKEGINRGTGKINLADNRFQIDFYTTRPIESIFPDRQQGGPMAMATEEGNGHVEPRSGVVYEDIATPPFDTNGHGREEDDLISQPHDEDEGTGFPASPPESESSDRVI